MSHKFNVNDKVKLPGTQWKFTGSGWANKFLWDATGTVEALGWTKPHPETKIVSGGEPVYIDGKLHHYTSIKTETTMVQYPIYKVDGKWIAERELRKI